MQIFQIDFETILPYWRKLWPDRVSPIEKTSWMKFLGGGEDFSQRHCVFLAGQEDRKIVAVNSFHIAETNRIARSRGLWVDPDYRSRGFGQQMLLATCDAAEKLGCAVIWSYPRDSSLKTYESAGFSRASDLIDGETGKNCYALKLLHKNVNVA